MKVRKFLFYIVGVLFFASLIIVPVGASAEENGNLTKQIMSGSNPNPMTGALKKEVQITNSDKKKREFQVDLGNELKAFISEGESPYGKDLNGKPLNGRYRTTFGFRIPL